MCEITRVNRVIHVVLNDSDSEVCGEKCLYFIPRYCKLFGVVLKKFTEIDGTKTNFYSRCEKCLNVV